MSLVTRCPACSTAFRVQADQLSLRGGKVRCGKCGGVFDGVSALVHDDDPATARGPSPQLALFDPGRLAAEARREAEEAARREAELQALHEAEREAQRAAEADAARVARDAAARETARIAAQVLDPAGVDAEAVGRVKALPVQAAAPEFLADEPPKARFTVLWALLTLLGACALAAQALVHFRTEAALLAPELRPWLVTACEVLGCEVRLPRRPELMSIDSSDLQAEPARGDGVRLTAVLRNRAPYPQEFPALELTLTDENDRAVVRRVFTPAEYLGRARAAQQSAGIGPGAELGLRVELEARDVEATGYRLYLFYP